MKLSRYSLFFSTLFLTLASAWCQDIHYNYDRSADFAAYKTYQWVDVPAKASGTPDALPSPPPGLPAIPGGLPNLPGGARDVRSTGTEDQLLDQDIKRAVDAQLVQKGLTKVEKNGDLLVSYQAAENREIGLNLFGSGFGGRGMGGMWDGSVQGQTSTISIGTLVVGVYDPAKKQLIWRGDATKTIDPKKNPDKNYKNLQKAMEKLFKNYPPPRSK